MFSFFYFRKAEQRLALWLERRRDKGEQSHLVVNASCSSSGCQNGTIVCILQNRVNEWLDSQLLARRGQQASV